MLSLVMNIKHISSEVKEDNTLPMSLCWSVTSEIRQISIIACKINRTQKIRDTCVVPIKILPWSSH